MMKRRKIGWRRRDDRLVAERNGCIFVDVKGGVHFEWLSIESDKERLSTFRWRALVFFPTKSMGLRWLVNAVTGGSIQLLDIVVALKGCHCHSRRQSMSAGLGTAFFSRYQWDIPLLVSMGSSFPGTWGSRAA